MYHATADLIVDEFSHSSGVLLINVSLINVAQTFQFAPNMPYTQSLCYDSCLWRAQIEFATQPKC